MSGGKALQNSTTVVDRHKSIAEIQHHLMQHGATKIVLDIDQGIIFGIIFAMKVGDQEIGFKLPVNIDACYSALVRDNRAGKLRNSFVNVEQAERTAWRIIRDWVVSQVGIIESGQVKAEVVFLPYMLMDGRKTVGDMLPETLKRLALPSPESY